MDNIKQTVVKIWLLGILTAYLIISVGCSGMQYKIQGVNLNRIKDASLVEVGAGVVSSLLVHEAGHILSHEFRNEQWSLALGMGPEIEFFPSDDGDVRWSARSGFLLQNVFGAILNAVSPKSDFTIGYTMFAAAEWATYPIRRSGSGDFYNMTHAGENGGWEYGFHGAFALFNVYQALKED